MTFENWRRTVQNSPISLTHRDKPCMKMAKLLKMPIRIMENTISNERIYFSIKLMHQNKQQTAMLRVFCFVLFQCVAAIAFVRICKSAQKLSIKRWNFIKIDKSLTQNHFQWTLSRSFFLSRCHCQLFTLNNSFGSDFSVANPNFIYPISFKSNDIFFIPKLVLRDEWQCTTKNGLEFLIICDMKLKLVLADIEQFCVHDITKKKKKRKNREL